jgi:hypothetical protein
MKHITLVMDTGSSSPENCGGQAAVVTLYPAQMLHLDRARQVMAVANILMPSVMNIEFDEPDRQAPGASLNFYDWSEELQSVEGSVPLSRDSESYYVRDNMEPNLKVSPLDVIDKRLIVRDDEVAWACWHEDEQIMLTSHPVSFDQLDFFAKLLR